jgi:hypothetical protein
MAPDNVLKACTVKPDNAFPVYEGDWHAHLPGLAHEFLRSKVVKRNILLLKADAFM